MTPAFSSWDAFISMGGYALYIWLAVGLTLISLLGLVGHTLWQSRQIRHEIYRHQQRETRIRQAKAQQETPNDPSS